MRHWEKATIFAIMLMVLIYTVNVDRKSPDPKNETAPISTPLPPASPKSEAGFFPESDPEPEDESIIEETFTEVP